MEINNYKIVTNKVLNRLIEAYLYTYNLIIYSIEAIRIYSSN